MMVLVMEYFDPEEIQYPRLYRAGIVPKDASLLAKNLGEILPAMSEPYSRLDEMMKYANELQEREETEYGIVINSYGSLSTTFQREIQEQAQKEKEDIQPYE